MKTRQIRNQKSLLVIGACALVLSGLLGAGASKITGNPFAGVGVATLGVVLSVLLLRREHGRAKLQNRLDQRTKKILGLLQEKKRPLAPVAPQAKARVTEVSEPRSSHGTVRPLNIDTRRLEEERCWAEARAVVPFGPTIDRIKNYYTPTQRETSSVRVAAVCDEFTYNSISPDCDLETVRPNDWREVFERHKPEVFFCESAWVGMPSSQHPWRGKIYASYLFDKENRSELIQILEHCKRRGIPTVFWNKEDPTHFGDRTNDFVRTAALFDYIRTTAIECVEDYKRTLRRESVGVMPFAVAPTSFSPDPTLERSDRAVFAGSWYVEHSGRNMLMRESFAALRDSGITLDIYDRHYKTTNPAKQFPEEFSNLIRQGVPHGRTADLYRRNGIGVNINTVTDSATMCARRVFEMAACGIGILSNQTPAMEAFLPGGVLTPNMLQDLGREGAINFVREMALPNLQQVMQFHTYSTRLAEVFSASGIRARSAHTIYSRVVIVRNHSEASRAVKYQMDSRTGSVASLLVVSRSVPSHEVGEYYTRYTTRFTQVVSQTLLDRGIASENTLLGTAFAYLVDGSKEMDLESEQRVARRLLAHSQYCARPIAQSENGAIRWVSRKGTDVIVSAQILPKLLTDDNQQICLEVAV